MLPHQRVWVWARLFVPGNTHACTRRTASSVSFGTRGPRPARCPTEFLADEGWSCALRPGLPRPRSLSTSSRQPEAWLLTPHLLGRNLRGTDPTVQAAEPSGAWRHHVARGKAVSHQPRVRRMRCSRGARTRPGRRPLSGWGRGGHCCVLTDAKRGS